MQIKQALTLAIALGFAIAGTSIARADIQTGTYQGTGNWKCSCGDEGAYQAKLDLSQNHYASTITLGARTVTVNFDFVPCESGGFDVLNHGHRVGSGSCNGNECHITATVDGDDFEETLVFKDNHLYRTGSESCSKGTTIWSDDLILVPSSK